MKNTLSQRITETQLAELQARKITTTKLAKELGTSLTHLSRTLSAAGFTKDPSVQVEDRKQASKDYGKRHANRLKLAQQVLENKIPVELACCEARCSPRTMYRYMKHKKESV